MEIRKIDLPKITDVRGNLSFAEEGTHLPFTVKRVFWIYDVPGGENRGGHAYRDTTEFIVALSGSFDVVIHDGKERHVFHLNRSYYGLLIPKMVWRELDNFSTNSLAMVVASSEYHADDYIRDFEEFKMLKNDETDDSTRL